MVSVKTSNTFDRCNFCSHVDNASYAKFCIIGILMLHIQCYLIITFPVLCYFHLKKMLLLFA